MSLATLKEVLNIAEANKSAIPAFSIDNLEVCEEIAAAAEANNCPAIMMVGQYAIKYGKLSDLSAIVKNIANSVSVPIVLHLDHGSSYEQAIQCIRAGFTSVMFDGSRLPLAENIRITKNICDAAHSVNVSVEAELGAIGGVEDGIIGAVNIVNPEDARTFIHNVPVDALAIGIGNAHGIYKSTPDLAFDILEEVSSIPSMPPLVLHGGSGIPDDMIRKAIRLGIRKINVATEIRLAYMEGMASVIESQNIYTVCLSGQAKAREIIEQKMLLFKNC